MEKYKKILFFGLIGLLLTACGTKQNLMKVNTASLMPQVVRLELNMSDYEVLGETPVSVEYRRYFGFITALDSVNHQEYDRRNVNIVRLRGHKDFILGRFLNKATYKVVEAYPQADFFVPVYTSEKVQKMFMGRQVTRKAVLRAYKMK